MSTENQENPPSSETASSRMSISSGGGGSDEESRTEMRGTESELVVEARSNSPATKREDLRDKIAEIRTFNAIRGGASSRAAGDGRSGRPPLKPRPTKAEEGAADPRDHHERSASRGERSGSFRTTGDETDPAKAPGQKDHKKTHARGVSWFDIENIAVESSPAGASSLSSPAGAALINFGGDGTGFIGDVPASDSLIFPSSSAEASPGLPLQPRLGGGPGGGKPRKTHARRDTNITLTDLTVNPYEDEAEAAILRALERRDWEREEEDRDEKLRKIFAAHRPEDSEEMKEGTAISGDSFSMGRTSVDGSVHAVPENKVHRRKPTMKDLAGQLQKMQGDDPEPTVIRSPMEKFATDKAGNVERRIPENANNSAAAASSPISPVDVLANNANILFRGKSPSWDEALDNVEAQISPSNKSAENSVKQLNVRTEAESEATGPCNKSKIATDGKTMTKADDENEEEDRTPSSGDVKINGRRTKPRRSIRQRLDRGREVLQEVCHSSVPHMRFYLNTVILLVFIALVISSILFYAAGNPIAGCDDELVPDKRCASWSWWFIFLGIRQIITLCLSKAFEVVFVDALALHTRITLRLFGPFVALMIVQARGWPYILTYWAVWDFCMLYGKSRFAGHWLFYQDAIGLFNADNPSGTVLSSDIYFRILIAAIVAGVATAFKRVLLALYLGKKSAEHYGPQVEKMMHRMILLSSVAHLAENIDKPSTSEKKSRTPQVVKKSPLHLHRPFKKVRRGSSEEVKEEEKSPERSFPSTPQQTPNSDVKRFRQSILTLRNSADSVKSRAGDDMTSVKTGASTIATPKAKNDERAKAHLHLHDSTKLKLSELVGDWEEPKIKVGSKSNDVSINDVLQFRQAVRCLDHKYPFSRAFGRAESRESCVESSQRLYERLRKYTPENKLLPFETIARAALDRGGELDEDRAKRLIRLFRPDRDGNLTAIDFVKSCDSIYKKLRTLRAAIANSSQIERAFEIIVNWVFYFVLGMVVLTIARFDPWTLFLSLSGLILSFAFMFGKAASNYFEGILLILVRRPYDIGDRIAISNPQIDTSPSGSSAWYVEEVTLFTTTVRNATTNEVATYSNGSLASSRIINGARSPKANIYIYLKFASDVPYERVIVFKSVVESFVKDRPRQWLGMTAFRATRIEADLGYIEYAIVLEHVEKWQNIGPILNSKAEISSFCLEVAKKLGMKYQAPPLPVNLSLSGKPASVQQEEEASPLESSKIEGQREDTLNTPDLGAIANLFAPDLKKASSK